MLFSNGSLNDSANLRCARRRDDDDDDANRPGDVNSAAAERASRLDRKYGVPGRGIELYELTSAAHSLYIAKDVANVGDTMLMVMCRVAPVPSTSVDVNGGGSGGLC